MALYSEPIRLNEVGPYGELITRPNPDGLVVVQVPPFEHMLPFNEQQKGRKLTTEEVEEHRQRQPSIVMTRETAEKLRQARAARR